MERVALVVAHPGHELRVFGWLRSAPARVFVLTDGSGRSNRSRLSSTERLLGRLGALPGSIFGRLTDRQAYSALLEHDFSRFIDLAEELADELGREPIVTVAGDAAEGYNPMHDACRLLIDAAVTIHAHRSGRRLANYDFALDGSPDACPRSLRPRAIRLELDHDLWSMKLEAARSYPELAGEVEASLSALGPEAFQVECLRPCGAPQPSTLESSDREGWRAPFYERHGQSRVRDGQYGQVIRKAAHLDPLARSLDDHVAGRA